MKLAVVIFLGVCVGVAVSEFCRETRDCDHETCSGDGWAITCHRGVCTCEHGSSSGGSCTTVSDCTGRCPDGGSQHCVDNNCRCFRN